MAIDEWDSDGSLYIIYTSGAKKGEPFTVPVNVFTHSFGREIAHA